MAAKCCDNDETFVEPIDVSRVLAEPLPLVTERYFKKYYSVGECVLLFRTFLSTSARLSTHMQCLPLVLYTRGCLLVG